MLRKYRPAAAMAAEIHRRRLDLRVRKKWRTGTMTIYMAVRKPAFPTSVVMIPACCRLEATARKKPQAAPARRSFREKIPVPARLFRNRTRGSRTADPIT